MQNFLLTGVFMLVTSISLSGAEFYQVMKGGRQPNHLVPTPAPGDYESKIAKLLFLTDGNFGRMVARPSFEAEFCLSVHADISESSIKKHDGWWLVPDEEKTYVMTVTSASENIWGSIPQNSKTNKDTDIKISRIDRKISLDLAIAIQRVWAKALHLTRYPSVPSNGLDGTTYQFSVWVRGRGDLQGETWSPELGLPRDLVTMGTELIAFVRQDAKGKELTEKDLIKQLKKLESKIPKA
jgi:hypothetical protein